MTIKLIVFFLALLLACSAQSTDSKYKRSIDSLYIKDVICADKEKIYLNYSPNKRNIWLSSHKYGSYVLVRHIDKNGNPELVGEDRQIKFITSKIIKINNKKFIGLTYAERSRTNDGGGQCGAGSEVFFVAYELLSNRMKEINRFLIQSCAQPVFLDDVDGDIQSAITVSNQYVKFKWFIYYDKPNNITGSYDFAENKLTFE